MSVNLYPKTKVEHGNVKSIFNFIFKFDKENSYEQEAAVSQKLQTLINKYELPSAPQDISSLQ